MPHSRNRRAKGGLHARPPRNDPSRPLSGKIDRCKLQGVGTSRPAGYGAAASQHPASVWRPYA